jgi:hypothetical protein
MYGHDTKRNQRVPGRQHDPADLEEVEYKKECVRETMDEETATWGSTDMTEIDTLEAFIRMVELAEHTASPRHRDPGDRRDAAADLKRYNVLLAAVGFYEPRTDEYCREAVRNGINVLGGCGMS